MTRVRQHDTTLAAIASILATAVLIAIPVLSNADEPDTVAITIEAQRGFQFQPSQVEVPAGRKIALTLKNTAVMGHNLRIPELDIMTKTITQSESDTVRFTIEKAGTYSFECQVPGHAAAGMTGKLTVN